MKSELIIDSGFAFRRSLMVEKLWRDGVITNPSIAEAFEIIPRHLFVPKSLWHKAYEDQPLPIIHDQTISQPSVIANMLEILEPRKDLRVLEIGTGSGYQTALLAFLSKCVFSIERIKRLADYARANVYALKFDNVTIQVFDGTLGWKANAPFDRIIVSAAAPAAPKPLLEQLKDGGRMVVPEGTRDKQHICLYTKVGNKIERVVLNEVSFVPLIGAYGWEDSCGNSS